MSNVIGQGGMRMKKKLLLIAAVLALLALRSGSFALTYDFESTPATACTGLTVCVLTVDGVPLEIRAGLKDFSGDFTQGLEGAALFVVVHPDPIYGGLGVVTNDVVNPQIQIDTSVPGMGEAVVFFFDPSFIAESITLTACFGGEGPRIFVDGDSVGDYICPSINEGRSTIPLDGRSSVLLITPLPDPNWDDDNDFYVESIEGVVEVVIDGCRTGVYDHVYLGSTITELIAGCADQARNHGQFVRCVAHLAGGLKRAGIVSGREKGRIQRCAARADIP